MISTAQLAQMKRGSYLINNARGKVVDIPALIEALKSGHLAGCAIDVFPSEPGSNGSPFDDSLNSWASTLCSLPNVILTPHIGGSTEEAQRMIGEEVASSLSGISTSVPQSGRSISLKSICVRSRQSKRDNVRVCHVHINQPGVLKQVNDVLSPYNVEKQYSDSKGDVAYLMADIADVSPNDINKLKEMISQTKSNIFTRLLA
jgi:D-3-phosphoglycerate dehydrogenase